MDKVTERRIGQLTHSDQFALEADIFTSTTTSVVIRSVRPDDIELIHAMHQRLSPASIYFRYLRSYTPTLADVRRVCQLAVHEGAAFIAAVEEPAIAIVGLAYYVIDPEQRPPVAEPAILIEDAFQSHGLGRMMLQRLIQHALAQGIRAFRAHVHPANHRILHLIRTSALPIEEEVAEGTRVLKMLLAPDSAATVRLSGQDLAVKKLTLPLSIS